MVLLPLAIATLLLATPSSFPNDIDPAKDKWWECLHFFRWGEEPAALSGRLVRTLGYDGAEWSASYEMWGPQLRVEWRVVQTPRGIERQISHVSVEIPPAYSRGGGIYGYLFGDGELAATVTMLDPRNAHKGYAAVTASFRGDELAAGLADARRWAFVAADGDGTEIVRRDLPVPDRAARDHAFALHWTAIEAAWSARDENRLVTTSADKLLPDRAVCLLSTPAARDEMNDSSISIRAGK